MREKYKQRRQIRLPVTLTVGIHTAAGRSFGTLYDISRSGAFVAVDPPPGAGSPLTLMLRLKDGSELRLPAEVKHSMGDDSPKLVSGVGIEFLPLDDHSATQLDQLLERLRRHEDPRG